MNLNRVIEQMRDRKMIANLRNTITILGCMALIVFGCAQNKGYESSSIKPNTNSLALAGNFRDVVVDDLNGDGHLDVIGGASSPGMVTINYGDGRGGISETQVLPVNGDVQSVAVADFNEDGLNDVVFSVQRISTGIRIWLNQSKRKWKDLKGPIEINNYQSVKTADVNGDGHMDIIAANATSETQGGIQVWLGDGKGGWLGESGPTVTGMYMDVAIVDLNGDAALDLIGAGWGTHGALRVWFGDGAGNWSSGSAVSKGSFYGIRIGDINLDGRLDIFAGSYRSGTRILLGDGQGGFKKMMSPEAYVKRKAQANPKAFKNPEELTKLVEESFWTVLPVDFDGDGAVDILASSLNRKGILAWKNAGRNRWRVVNDLFPSSGTYYNLTLSDLNGDGYPDICAASAGEGIKIWPGQSGAAFTARNMEIEQLSDSNRLAALEAPLENDVFATINGMAEYKIGPRDILEITFWNSNTPTKEEIRVRQDGKISFGFVEDLTVTGLTSSQLDNLLTGHLKEYVKKPRLDVVIIKYDSKFVTLLGAINDKGFSGTGPGKYKLKGKTTLLEALTRAGGPARDADLRNVNVRRQNGRSITLDLFAAIKRGDPEQDLVLDSGDVVYLPALNKKANRVYVFGEVEKPGAYPFTGPQMKLIDAISEAGGPTVFATTSSTMVVRGDINKPEVLSSNLQRLLEEGDQTQNVVLASGDFVYVPRNAFGDVNIFLQQIKPLFDLVRQPGQTYQSYK
jgi:protein involved in polysaccharide export with SLBB domain